MAHKIQIYAKNDTATILSLERDCLVILEKTRAEGQHEWDCIAIFFSFDISSLYILHRYIYIYIYILRLYKTDVKCTNIPSGNDSH